MKVLVNRIKPGREGTHYHSPIKIDGVGALTYEIVRDYMSTKMNVVTVERESAEEYLIFIGSDDTISDDMVDSNGKVKLRVHQSASQYGGIRSAINHVYTLARVKMPQ